MKMLRHWLALLSAAGVGPALGRALLARGGTPEALLAAGPKLWRESGAGAASCADLANPDWAAIDQQQRWFEGGPHRHLIPWGDAAYPARLAELTDAPLALFVEGDVEALKLPQLAVVGSRSPTPAGAEAAREFAAFLSRSGLTITSGLAQGIDAAAHEGALDGNGLTIAVMGTGPDQIYPSRHRALAERIAASGALVTEFPPGTSARPEHFPKRNRIISGLSQGVLVVEAALRSGSLITARQAVEQGREVFAIPGSIHNPLARGCHRLIRNGAKLVESGADILEELAGGISTPVERGRPAVDNARPRNGPPAGLPDGDYRRLLDALGDAPQRMDHLVERSGLTIDAVSSMLLILELQGQVAAVPGGAYMRTRSIGAETG